MKNPIGRITGSSGYRNSKVKLIQQAATSMLLFLSLHFKAQNDSLLRVEFRTMIHAMSEGADPEINFITNTADSLLLSDAGVFRMRWDSLYNDSTLLAHGHAPLMNLEAFFIAALKKDEAAAMKYLRLVQRAEWQPLESPLFPFVHRMAFDFFSARRDFEAAAYSQAELSRWTTMNWGLKEKMLEDSIRLQEEKMNQMTLDWKKKEAEEQRKMMLIGGALLVLLLALLIFWIMQMVRARRLKAKVMEQEVQMQDKSELEALTRKINDLKTEALQFRNTAQATIDKLNSMDADRRKTAAELKQLTEELNTALYDLKAQSESAKASLPPAVYMAMQNVATRLSASAMQRIQTLREINK